MSESFKIFRASPEACFLSIDKKILEIESQMKNCIELTESISALGDQFLTAKMPLMHASVRPLSWTYLAILPNAYFSDVFEPEEKGGAVKRWVGRSGNIGARIGLPRTVQYDFTVSVADFISPEIEASFTLKINGETYPWLEVVDRRYKTIILESQTADDLEFELGVNAAADTSGKDVTFSFTEITINGRG